MAMDRRDASIRLTRMIAKGIRDTLTKKPMPGVKRFDMAVIDARMVQVVFIDDNDERLGFKIKVIHQSR